MLESANGHAFRREAPFRAVEHGEAPEPAYAIAGPLKLHQRPDKPPDNQTGVKWAKQSNAPGLPRPKAKFREQLICDQ